MTKEDEDICKSCKVKIRCQIKKLNKDIDIVTACAAYKEEEWSKFAKEEKVKQNG